MDRLQFSRLVIQKELGFTPHQLDYVFALPGKKTFEVIFTTFMLFEQCLVRFEQRKLNNPRLANIELTSLSEREPKAVTVIMYSEKVTTEDIITWLSFHCSVIRSMELRDEDGVRTGARRIYIRLRREGVSGDLHHLPSTIQLGPHRGHVFYAGQPKTCRKCGSSSHLAANCNATFCRNCQSAQHTTKDCNQPMRCNLCSSSSHTFRSCPRSYANRVRQSTSIADTEIPPAEEQPAPEGPESGQAGQHQGPPPQAPPAPINAQAVSVQTNAQATSEPTTSRDQQALHLPSEVASGSKTGDETGGESGDDTEDEEEVIQPGQTTMETRTGRNLPEELEPSDVEQPNQRGQPGQAPVESAPAGAILGNCKDLRDLLDLGFSDLPFPEDTAGTSSSSSPCHDVPIPKRSKEDSGDSFTNVPDAEVWSNIPPPFPAYLDPQALSAFSATTQMGGVAGEAQDISRKDKKKKRKKNRKEHSSASA